MTYIHATAVLIGGKGLLIRGPSRSGKSTLALDLLQGGHGLAAWLIGDDRIAVDNIGTRIEMRGHPRIAGKIEKRGATPLESEILDKPYMASGLLHYVIELSDNAVTPALSARRFCGADMLHADLPRGIDRAAWVLDKLVLKPVEAEPARFPDAPPRLANRP